MLFSGNLIGNCNHMAWSGRVRWLKAVEGGVELTLLGAKRHVATAMRRMGSHIAGTDDTVATYIKQSPRAQYNDGSKMPGAIAGILWLAPMPPGRDVHTYPENDEYEVGWPVAHRSTVPQGPALIPLLRDIYGSRFQPVWNSMKGSMTGGRPFRIDEGKYAELGDALTDWYRSVGTKAT